jgi:UDP-N-acetylmuramoyl-tripeptide--D-alanyl-D-alanine ligase
LYYELKNHKNCEKMIELKLSEVATTLKAAVFDQDIKFIGCSTDSRHILPNSLFIALRGQRFDGHDFITAAQQQGASAIMVEKPVTYDLPTLQVANTLTALGDLARLWRQRFKLPIIAITGSNGKTTTKEMLRAILLEHLHKQNQSQEVLANQGNLNNEIGVPLTLFNLAAHHRYAVIEMGANHLGEIAYLSEIAQPQVATITQCAPAHLEGFGSIERVARAKGEIFTHLMPRGTAIINRDDFYAPLWSELAASHSQLDFAIETPAAVMAQNIQLQPSQSQFTLNTPLGKIKIQLPLPGKHNIMNALAASTCAIASGCSLSAIEQGLQTMQPISGRLQIKPGIKNTTIIDDTYNANPTSLNAALSILNNHPQPHWLILGEMKELGAQSDTFHRQAGLDARQHGIERLWALGKLTRLAVESFGQGGYHFQTHQELIAALLTQLPQHTTLLIKGSRGMQMEKIVTALLPDYQRVKQYMAH